MKNIVFILFVIFTISCRNKETTTVLSAIIVNKSYSKITISHFINGSTNSSSIIELAPNDTFIYSETLEKGNLKEVGFKKNYYFSPNDSIIVTFNDSFFVTHYYDSPPINQSNKSFLIDSDRNLANFSSYTIEREKYSKWSFKNINTYTFTESDYEYAKQ